MLFLESYFLYFYNIIHVLKWFFMSLLGSSSEPCGDYLKSDMLQASASGCITFPTFFCC